MTVVDRAMEVSERQKIKRDAVKNRTRMAILGGRILAPDCVVERECAVEAGSVWA
jgi:hypothetical protein